MKIGIDMGGSHIAVATVNNQGKIIEKIEEDIQKGNSNAQYILNYVDKAIEKLRKTADIEAIGIACPGNPKGSKIENLVNLSIAEVDFKELEKKYSVKIKSVNDAKGAAIAEKTYGALKQSSDCVFLCLGTGIGGAVFLNNQLLVANRNPGFELGHMVIEREGIECNCGKKGCFETYSSIRAFKQNVAEVLGIENDFSGQYLRENLLDLNNVKIRKVVDEFVENLVIGIGNLIDIFEPEIVVLGGSFSHYEKSHPVYKMLLDKINESQSRFNNVAAPKIELAKLKNNAGIIGATIRT